MATVSEPVRPERRGGFGAEAETDSETPIEEVVEPPVEEAIEPSGDVEGEDAPVESLGLRYRKQKRGGSAFAISAPPNATARWWRPLTVRDGDEIMLITPQGDGDRTRVERFASWVATLRACAFMNLKEGDKMPLSPGRQGRRGKHGPETGRCVVPRMVQPRKKRLPLANYPPEAEPETPTGAHE